MTLTAISSRQTRRCLSLCLDVQAPSYRRLRQSYRTSYAFVPYTAGCGQSETAIAFLVQRPTFGVLQNCRECQAISSRPLRIARCTYLWHRIRRHQPEDVPLNPLIQLDHGLQLTRMQRLGCHCRIQRSPDNRRCAFPRGNIGDDLAHIRHELFA